LPILAALGLALAGLIVGAMLVTFARPGGVADASPTGSPVSSLPIFVPTSPTPGPSPSPGPSAIESFPGLPTPLPDFTPFPSGSGFVTPPPSLLPTPTPTATPSRTPRPTPTASPTPTETPTPTPIALTCDQATGNPTANVTLGYGNRTNRISKGWCLDYVVFHVVTTVPPGSTFGKSALLENNKAIANFSCDSPAPCANDVQVPLNQKLARFAALISYSSTCTGDPSTPDDECATVGYNATATLYYELATIAAP
jgi:hypothetical protein